MAAGLGFKDFTTGEVLTAADVDGYLMQGIWVFASAAARDAAVTSPQEGNFAFLKDTNTTTYYTGSAWTNLDTTGMVNPMTTTGDIIYSSSGSTPARLGIGSTGNVLTVSGGLPVWSAPAGGGKVLQVVSATTTTSTSINTTTLTDTTLTASITPSSATSKILILTQQRIFTSRSNSVFSQVKGALLRGSTKIVDYSAGSSGGQFINYIEANSVSSGAHRFVQNYNYLDSPATTSSTTYKTQLALDSTASSATLTVQEDSTVSSIILMEIGA